MLLYLLYYILFKEANAESLSKHPNKLLGDLDEKVLMHIQCAKVLNEDEWIRWVQWMRICFRYGTLSEQCKLIKSERWFNPDFENFINKKVAPKPESNR